MFRIAALPADVLEEVRSSGVDAHGNSLERRVASGGEPLRCCLRDAAAGEEIGLIAYCPFPWTGVYAESGPVFLHTSPCAGYTAPDAYPSGFRHRQQIFRAYGHDRTIVDARIVDGADAEPAIAELLADPDVAFLHSRNVAYGCYMFTIHHP